MLHRRAINSAVEVISAGSDFVVVGSTIEGIRRCGAGEPKSGILRMPGTLQASGISECGHDRDAMNLQVGVGGSLSTEETLTAVAAELEALIAANQNTPLADRIEVRQRSAASVDHQGGTV
jgi:hypothetical protein